MGSVSQTSIKTVNKLNKLGKKVGAINVRLFRPFNSTAFTEKLPKTVKRIAVLDRTKESTAPAEPLCEDVIYSCQKAGLDVKIIGGRYGLGSKEPLSNEHLTLDDMNTYSECMLESPVNIEKNKKIYIYATIGDNDDDLEVADISTLMEDKKLLSSYDKCFVFYAIFK